MECFECFSHVCLRWSFVLFCFLPVGRIVLNSVVQASLSFSLCFIFPSRQEYRPLPLALAPSSFWLICIWVKIKVYVLLFLDFKFILKEGLCRGKLPRGGISLKMALELEMATCCGCANSEFSPRTGSPSLEYYLETDIMSLNFGSQFPLWL